MALHVAAYHKQLEIIRYLGFTQEINTRTKVVSPFFFSYLYNEMILILDGNDPITHSFITEWSSTGEISGFAWCIGQFTRPCKSISALLSGSLFYFLNVLVEQACNYSVLHAAVGHENVAMICYLLDFGANLECKVLVRLPLWLVWCALYVIYYQPRRTPLMAALMDRRSKAVISALLSRGANIGSRNEDGNTAYTIAKQSYPKEIVKEWTMEAKKHSNCVLT